MPRQARESSGTGIYHVMMRGINHQNIFEEQEDYYQFLNTLDMMAQSYEPNGTPSGRNYILYAYCLMSNHIHLLIREREWMVRYNEVMAFMEREHRKPSKYYPEEKLMFHFIHHNKKLYNAGTLKAERVEKFERLLALCEEYKRVNQYV